MDARRFGQLGEVYAARYLWKKGYTVVASNYKNRFGEIDLVAIKRKTVAFIEVKTRNKNSIASPKEAVDSHKQRRLIAAALSLLKNEQLKNLQPRFDVIEVIMDHDTPYNKAHINHIKNAFTAEGYNAFV